MIQPKPKPERLSLLDRLDSLFHELVKLSNTYPDSLHIFDAKVLCSNQLALEQVNWDLMQLIINHLDVAQLDYSEAQKLYNDAWDIFLDIRIPFVAIEPTPLSLDDTERIAVPAELWEVDHEAH